MDAPCLGPRRALTPNFSASAVGGFRMLGRPFAGPWLALGLALGWRLAWPSASPWLALGLALRWPLAWPLAGSWPGPGWPLAWPWLALGLAWPLAGTWSGPSPGPWLAPDWPFGLALGLALGWPLAWPLAGPWPGPWLALGALGLNFEASAAVLGFKERFTIYLISPPHMDIH